MRYNKYLMVHLIVGSFTTTDESLVFELAIIVHSTSYLGLEKCYSLLTVHSSYFNAMDDADVVGVLPLAWRINKRY